MTTVPEDQTDPVIKYVRVDAKDGVEEQKVEFDSNDNIDRQQLVDGGRDVEIIEFSNTENNGGDQVEKSEANVDSVKDNEQENEQGSSSVKQIRMKVPHDAPWILRLWEGTYQSMM